jgi:hypothetical protein
MQTVKTIGLDIAKSVFQVHGIDAYGQVAGLRSPELVDLRWEQIDLDTQSCTFVESNRQTGDDTFDRPRNYRFAPTRLRAYSVMLFVLCMLAALFVPLRLAHGWVSLLSDAPINSSRVWIDGLIWSIVLGWLIALIFGTIYNWIVARRALQEVS